MPCSTEAHTRFCDDHVLNGGAVSVPKISLSSSPTAPSVQTEMGYTWDRCGMSCKVESRMSHGLKPLRVWRAMSTKSKTVCRSCAKRPMTSAMASAMVARVTIGGHSCMVWPQQRVGRALSEFLQFQYSRFKKDAGDLQGETFVYTPKNTKVYVPQRQ